MEKSSTLQAHLSQRPGGGLYHYTDAQGLLGIMHTASLWATNAFHLNDSQEYRYALSVLRRTIKADTKRDSRRDEVREQLLDSLSSIPANVQIFVASFSERRDVLSQWLAYGKGRNGYSLGVRPAHFREAFRAGFKLLRCIYGPEEQINMARGVIDALTRADDANSEDSDALSRAALVALAAIKHPGFHQEKEWRLVKVGGAGWATEADTLFRQGQNGIVPYVQAPMLKQKSFFRPASITIGPNDDPKSAAVALDSFLGANDMRHLFGRAERPEVLRSRTPIRP